MRNSRFAARTSSRGHDRATRHVASATEAGDGKLERKKSKRQRIVHFFRSRKQAPEVHDEVPVRIPLTLFVIKHRHRLRLMV